MDEIVVWFRTYKVRTLPTGSTGRELGSRIAGTRKRPHTQLRPTAATPFPLQVPEGKGENDFAFGAKWLSAAEAVAVIEETHGHWRAMIDGRPKRQHATQYGEEAVLKGERTQQQKQKGQEEIGCAVSFSLAH